MKRYKLKKNVANVVGSIGVVLTIIGLCYMAGDMDINTTRDLVLFIVLKVFGVGAFLFGLVLTDICDKPFTLKD